MILGKTIFLLGAGGMGMAALARYLSHRGYVIFGWDDFATEERKQQLSYIDWTPKIPESCKTVIYTSAIDADHPLLLSAQKQCKCYLRGQFLAQLLANKKVCAICGSHGKSTTTAYLVHFFKYHNIPISYILGAEFQNDFYTNASFDVGAQWTLLELDESDGTMELFSPEATVILNTDWDHPTHYPNAEAYQAAFERLCTRTRRWVFSEQPFKTQGQLQTFDARGLAQDKIAAECVFKTLTGIETETKDASTFPGIKRRHEILLQTQRLTVISDYAHHPEELRALLNSFPQNATLHVVFEPHRISRLNQFFPTFVSILKDVKNLYLCPIYQAFEKDQTLTRSLETALPQAKTLSDLPCDGLLTQNTPTYVVFVGAGNVDKQARQWLQNLKQQIQQYAQENFISLTVDQPLKQHSLLGIGGTALAYAQPNTPESLQKLLKFCETLHLESYIIGGGSNIVIPERYDGLVLQLNAPYWETCNKLAKGTFEVRAGCFLKNFLDLAEKEGIGGFEFLDGIPGTLGGALAMNAGIHNLGILDKVQYVTIMDRCGNKRELQQNEIQYGYRTCESLKDYIVLSAVLKGEPSTPELVQNKRKALHNRRLNTQPQGKSLGCFFKNTDLGSTGKLLDQLGLKGTSFGNVFISPIHANFILNKGHGTFPDVLKLMRYIRHKVNEEVNILLEPEVRLLGKKWEEVL
jgi:UDP-N-acetylenolpyruvoylglucosamine reductase